MHERKDERDEIHDWKSAAEMIYERKRTLSSIFLSLNLKLLTLTNYEWTTSRGYCDRMYNRSCINSGDHINRMYVCMWKIVEMNFHSRELTSQMWRKRLWRFSQFILKMTCHSLCTYTGFIWNSEMMTNIDNRWKWIVEIVWLERSKTYWEKNCLLCFLLVTIKRASD